MSIQSHKICTLLKSVSSLESAVAQIQNNGGNSVVIDFATSQFDSTNGVNVESGDPFILFDNGDTWANPASLFSDDDAQAIVDNTNSIASANQAIAAINTTLSALSTTTITAIYADGSIDETGTSVFARGYLASYDAATEVVSINFDNPHPNGTDYSINITSEHDDLLGNERKEQWFNKTQFGFDVYMTVDDNGTNPDPVNSIGFDFQVTYQVNVITGAI